MRTTWLLICAAGLLGCEAKPSSDPAPATTTAPPAEVAEWEGCAKLKSEVADATMKFSEPDYSGEIAIWRVNAFGVNFAVPKGEWEILPSADATGQITVVLLERKTDDTIVWTRESSIQPDVPADERASNVHRKLVLGYQNTPADLTCALAARDAEVPIGEALVLKSIDAPGTTIAVHHNMHNVNDIARYASLDDHGQWQWEVWFPAPEAYIQATYRFKDEARAKAFVAAQAVQPGVYKGDAAEPPPAWIGLLQAALAAPTDAATWKALLKERKKSGASDKSLGAIRQLAEPASP